VAIFPASISVCPCHRSKTGVKPFWKTACPCRQFEARGLPVPGLFINSPFFPFYNSNCAGELSASGFWAAPGQKKRKRKGVTLMESAVNVSVDKGGLRLVGEIPVASSREDLEAFVMDIRLKLLGSKKNAQAGFFRLQIEGADGG
jgi:hypothetical protein